MFAAACSGPLTVAVDSTGFSEMCISRHYEKRMKELFKATYAGDVDSKMILVCDITDQHHHDVTRTSDVVVYLKESGIQIDLVLADKGYDFEEVHKLIKKELKAKAAIPAR